MCICEALKTLKYSQENVSRFLHFCDRTSKLRRWLSILTVFCVFENVEDIEDDFEYTGILYDDVEFSKSLIDQKICDTCSSSDVFWIWLILRSHFRFSWFSVNFLADFLSTADELLIETTLPFLDRYYQTSRTSISTLSMIRTSNWDCSYSQNFWIEQLTTRLSTVSSLTICPILLSTSTHSQSNAIAWFARSSHWSMIHNLLKPIETNSMRINWRSRIQSSKRSCSRSFETTINSSFLTILREQKKFLFKTLSWSNCEQSYCEMSRLSFSRWLRQTLRSRFSKMISLLTLDSKSL